MVVFLKNINKLICSGIAIVKGIQKPTLFGYYAHSFPLSDKDEGVRRCYTPPLHEWLIYLSYKKEFKKDVR